MKVRILHIVCTALLVFGPSFFLQSCSSAQQEDGDLEGDQQAASDEEGSGEEDVSEGGATNTAEEGTNNFNNENGEQVAEEGNTVLEGNQTQSDLEDIIAGQNAEPVDAGSAPMETAEAAPVGNAEAAPMDNSAAATPVADASATPAPSTPMAAISAGPALPEQGSKMPYIVRVGDTLSIIAKNIYGNPERWSEMAELTSIKNPNLVRPGDVVYYQLNQETLAFATAYEGTPRNEVTVQKGDTLAGIAQRVYGQQGDWKFVWRQNSNIDNPDRLEVGQTIYYLSPAALGAALDYAKSLTIAELLGNKIQKVETTTNSSAPTQTIDQPVSTSNSVSGFELATDIFNVFTTNFANAG